jgi:signal transduction histidine kinase
MESLLLTVSLGLVFLLSGFAIFALLIQFSTRIDNRFTPAGLLIVLLCFFCALDIWVHPGAWDKGRMVLQHCIAAIIIGCSYWSAQTMVERPHRPSLRVLWIISIVVSVSFLFLPYFINHGPKAQPGALYRFIFVPFILGSVCWISGYLVVAAIRGGRAQRRGVLLSLGGNGLLFISGLIDMKLMMSGNSLAGVDSVLVLGALAYCIQLSVILFERIVSVINQLHQANAKLHQSYDELHKAKNLRRLGLSVATVTHDLKNYTYSITGYITLLSQRISSQGLKEPLFDKVLEVNAKLFDYSVNILRFMHNPTGADGAGLLDIIAALREDVATRFATRKQHFVFEGPEQPCMVGADRHQLSSVWVNLIQNSFDAGANRVRIGWQLSPKMVVIVFTDNGPGCGPQQFGRLLTPFYTTKQAGFGTGLGLVSAQSVVETLGGSLAIYPGIEPDTEWGGLSIVICLPRGEDTAKQNLPKVTIISDGVEQQSELAAPFHNLGMVCRFVELKTWLKSRDENGPCFVPENLLPRVRSRQSESPHFGLHIDSRFQRALVQPPTRGTQRLLTEHWIARESGQWVVEELEEA